MSDGNDIIIRSPLEESTALSKTLAVSSLMPEALRNKPGDVLATILTGAELGLGPMQSIRGIHIIKGKASLSADLLGALCIRRPEICEKLEIVESTDVKCTYLAQRRGTPAVEMSFTMEDARKAELTGKLGDMFKKWPRQMLRARCLSMICKAIFPDLCFGLYVEGELPGDVPPVINERTSHVDHVKQALRDESIEGQIVRSDETTMQERIAACQSLVELQALGADIKALHPEDKAFLQPIYMKRKSELTVQGAHQT